MELYTSIPTSVTFSKRKLLLNFTRSLNAERREKHLREMFEAECVEMTDEDHAELSIMFQGENNIPEHMSSLWKQQQKLLTCKSKNAHRWHPK